MMRTATEAPPMRSKLKQMTKRIRRFRSEAEERQSQGDARFRRLCRLEQGSKGAVPDMQAVPRPQFPCVCRRAYWNRIKIAAYKRDVP